MIKAIIFDCFGVLAEDGWMPLKRKYIGENMKLAELVSDLGKQNEYGLLDNATHLRMMAEAMKINEEILEKALGVKVPHEELFEYIETELKPRYKIGLMTNANFNVLTDLFTKEQAVIFDASVMSFESKLIKPDKKMFELIAERLGVEMNECVFIDDQERYVTAAKDYGMQGITYVDTPPFKAELEAILANSNN